MSFDPFDVVVLPFPFTDKAASKRRPALVISSSSFNANHEQLILAMITTAKNSHWFSDVELAGWQDALLMVPCKVHFKLFTLDCSMVVRRLGTLSKSDQAAVASAFAQVLPV